MSYVNYDLAIEALRVLIEGENDGSEEMEGFDNGIKSAIHILKMMEKKVVPNDLPPRIFVKKKPFIFQMRKETQDTYVISYEDIFGEKLMETEPLSFEECFDSASKLVKTFI